MPQVLAVTPTARTLAECRKRGWLVGVVEQTIPHTFIKRDLFGFVDIVAVDDQPGAVLIQATGDNAGDVARRVTKIRGKARELEQCLRAGLRVQVWGWGKRGARGKRKVWTLRVVDVA